MMGLEASEMTRMHFLLGTSEGWGLVEEKGK